MILYGKLLEFDEEDTALVTEFLQIEYETESLNYPFTAPGFDEAAALWAAKIICSFCQLILYRENKEAELPELLPAYHGKITAGAVLSADLCLRFVPDLIIETKRIDADDPLIELMTATLETWQYPGIGANLDVEKIDLEIIKSNECLQQLYIDRIIRKKDLQRALLPGILPKIKTAMGMYTSLFWKELNVENKV
jgi:hypothetical protein